MTTLPPRRLRALALAGATLACGCAERPSSAQAAAAPAAPAVSALGRLQPGRTVVSVAAAPGERILSLGVREADRVEAGQLLAVLEGEPLRRAEVAAARAALGEAEGRLRVETDYAAALVEQARQGVRVLEAELEQARTDLARLDTLRAADLVAARDYEAQALGVRTKELALAKGRADLRAAEAGLARAPLSAAVESARAQLAAAVERLALTQVRAPIAGRVLRIFTWPGERIASDPILQMGDTDRMTVVAEVHEDDVGRVAVGQRATLSSPALGRELSGVVEDVGRMIFRQDVLDLDPRAARDTRVVEVRIRLDDSAPAAGLTNLEVQVRIQTPVAAGRPAAAR
ncbi:MAG: HlyD family efflux transporter periplasmic adaptor subunit [Vicinamibacteria bacterium]